MIFEVEDPGLSFVGARIIHIAHDFLAEILKRLRQAQVDGRPPNTLTFRAKITKWGMELPAVTGAAIKAAFEDAVPGGMASYGREKNRQLAELGFEKGFMTLETTIKASSADEVIDGFLGLTPLPVIDAKHFSTRFGIPIQVPLPWIDTPNVAATALTIKMDRTETCTVTVTRERDGAGVSFTGDLYAVPSKLTGPDRMILEADQAVSNQAGYTASFRRRRQFARIRRPAWDRDHFSPRIGLDNLLSYCRLGSCRAAHGPDQGAPHQSATGALGKSIFYPRPCGSKEGCGCG